MGGPTAFSMRFVFSAERDSKISTQCGVFVIYRYVFDPPLHRISRYIYEYMYDTCALTVVRGWEGRGHLDSERGWEGSRISSRGHRLSRSHLSHFSFPCQHVIKGGKISHIGQLRSPSSSSRSFVVYIICPWCT